MSASELLRRALAGSISPEEFDYKLRELEIGYRPRLRTYQTGEAVLFRARDLDRLDRPRASSELSYPPCHLTGPGRANAEGEQVFYASPQFAPSFMECGLKVGEYVLCSRWRNISPLALRELGFAADEDSSGIEKIYRELFTDSRRSIYAYSAQVARRIMCDKSLAGVAYPSRAMQARGENVAIKPIAVRGDLRALDASIYRVRKSDDHCHALQEIDFARVGESGALIWLGQALRHGGELRVVTNECEFRAYDAEGKLVEAA